MTKPNFVTRSSFRRKFCRSRNDADRHSTILRENTQEYEGVVVALRLQLPEIGYRHGNWKTPDRKPWSFSQEDPMNCSRCHGLMVEDDLIDLRESYLPMWTHGLRCVSCGNVVDPVIARNRRRQRATVGPVLETTAQVRTVSRHAKAA